MAKTKPKTKKTIVFFHPDLGIGGAERLVIDAAVGLQKRGHKIVIFTSHCDPKHCFDEARDGTLDVRVRGNTLVPPTLLSRFAILCAVLRQLHLLVQISVLTRELYGLRPDAFFVDQLSAGLPLLRGVMFRHSPVLFYCHFPDLLLVRGRDRWWKRLYRLPFDAWEQWSMGFADAVAVNSEFTKGVVERTWPRLARGTELRVVYPCIDTGAGKDKVGTDGDGGEDEGAALAWKDTRIVLSINRFERKKDVALAIRAYAGLPKEKRKGARLVVAGGYDTRVSENVNYHKELAELAESLGLTHATAKTIVTALSVPSTVDVLFFLSVPSRVKDMLLRSARLLVYTPSNEHFGIVPLEAMLTGTPVLAANTGGPTETVVDGVTGWLRNPADVPSWTAAVDAALNGMSDADRAAMSRAGADRVRANFAETTMAERLDGILREIENPPSRPVVGTAVVLALLASLAAAVGAVAAAKFGKTLSSPSK